MTRMRTERPSAYTVGVDVGGTKIATALVDASGTVTARHTSKGHSGRPPDEVIRAILEGYRTVVDSADPAWAVSGVGVGFAGHVHGEKGIVLTTSNLPGWSNYPLRDRLADRLNVPVVLENDANCAAWGEYRFGAGRGSVYMVYATFSTGYGIGIVIEGKLYRGATGTAGELGHTVVDVDGPVCSCGRRGCLMSYACGMAISRMARERLESDDPTLLRQFVTDPNHIDAEVVGHAARAGDRVARDILATAGRYCGIGLATVVEVLNPDRIVLGGGLVKIGPLLMEPCMKALHENIHEVLVGSAEIVFAELGEDAGLIGAAALVGERPGAVPREG
jgi:glucokinase